MKTLLLSFGLFLFLFVNSVNAQDQMYLKGSKEAIAVNIVEIGLDEIKYTPYSGDDSPVLVVPKSLVAKIIMKDGSKFEFADPMFDPAMYADQKRNALKISFLSPLVGSTQFTYERSTKPGQSLEATLGIIGLGWDPSGNEAKGATIKFGYKFIKSPNFAMRGMRYSHLLKGLYVRPEVILNFFNTKRVYDSGYYNPNSEASNVFSGAFVLNLGNQWVFSDSFLIDFYLGLGYGFQQLESESAYYDGFHYGFIGVLDEFPLVLTGNLRIGILLK